VLYLKLNKCNLKLSFLIIQHIYQVELNLFPFITYLEKSSTTKKHSLVDFSFEGLGNVKFLSDLELDLPSLLVSCLAMLGVV